MRLIVAILKDDPFPGTTCVGMAEAAVPGGWGRRGRGMAEAALIRALATAPLMFSSILHVENECMSLLSQTEEGIGLRQSPTAPSHIVLGLRQSVQR